MSQHAQLIFSFFFSFKLIFFLIFYCILGLGVHVQNMQDSCIGTHMAVCFAFFLPLVYLFLFFIETESYYVAQGGLKL